MVITDGIDTGLEQIKAGLAWHYKRYEMEQPNEVRFRYAIEEDTAKQHKIGLWVDRRSIPPWEWRKTPLRR